MRRSLYKYPSGSIREISCSKTKSGLSVAHLTLYNYRNSSMAPTRIEAYGDLADYINNLEGTDDEERYLEWDFFFDDCFSLVCIVIPSAGNSRPAKVLTCGISDRTLSIFGPQEHLQHDKPEPMDDKEFYRWRLHRVDTMGPEYDTSVLRSPRKETHHETCK